MAPYLSAGVTNSFVASLLGRQGNQIFLLPQSVDLSTLIWYNQERFGELQITPPTTQADWLRVCQKLRQAGSLPLVQGNREFWPMGNFGVELLGRSLGRNRLDSFFNGELPATPELLTPLGLFVEFAKGGYVDLPGVLDPGAIGNLSDLDAKVLFLSAKAVQHPIGSWFAADIRDAAERNELKFTPDLFPIPAAPGERLARGAVITGYQVNARTRHPQLAVEFLELLLSRPFQERFAALGNLSARTDAVQFTTNPIPRKLLGLLSEPGEMIPPPDTGYSPERADLFYQLCSKLLLGQLDLASAAVYWNDKQPRLRAKEQ